jgi:hypothetical protein
MQSVNARHLTVRNVPEELSAALEREKRRRGASLNQTVIDVLRQSLGVAGKRSNGLARLAGTWTEAEHRRFLDEIQVFEKIDPDWWQ